jgi:hypothetical protein
MAMRRTAFALTAGLVALGLAACGGSGPSMPGEPDDPMMMQLSAPSAAAQAAAQLAEDDDRRAGGAKHR